MLPRPVWLLAAGLFVQAFGNFLPAFLVLSLTSRGLSAGAAGIALTGYAAGKLAAPVFGGPLADRLARRAVISLGMTLNAVAVAVLAHAFTPALTTLSTVAAGLGSGLSGPAAAALLADLTPPARRVQGFAVQRLALNLGYTAGPAAAGLLARHGYAPLFITEAVTSLTVAVLSQLLLPAARANSHAQDRGLGHDDRISTGPAHTSTATHNDTADAAVVGRRDHDKRWWTQPPLPRLLIALVAVHIVYYQTLSTLPLVVRNAGYPPAVYGTLVAFNGALVIVLQLPIAARTRHRRRPATVALGFLLTTAGITALAVADAGPAALIVLTLCVLTYSLGEIIFDPVAQTWVTELAPSRALARTQAAYTAAGNAGLLLAPLLTGALYPDHATTLWLTCLTLGAAATILTRLPG